MKRIGLTLLLTITATTALADVVKERVPAPPDWWWPDRARDITGHWTDAFNALDLVPGPPFLLLFMAGTLLALGLCRAGQYGALHLFDGGGSPMRVPPSLKPHALDVAYLRDRRRGMLLVTACRLACPDVNLPVLTGRWVGRRTHSLGGGGALTELERAVADALERRVELPQLRKDPAVVAQLKRAERTAKAKLQALGFLPQAQSYVIGWTFLVVGLLLIDGVAAVRLIRSDLRGYKNVDLLWLLTIIATVVAMIVLMRVRQSGAGMAFLRQARREAAGAIRRGQAMARRGAEAETMYAIAACGIGVAKGTIYHEVHQKLEPPSSSSCSSCGGGGCGGGGCGGGGCGGG